MVDGHDLLPGTQSQFSRAYGQGDGRAQQGGLDMAVPVAVMPGQFVGVGQIGWYQTADSLLKIGHNAWLVLDGGKLTGGTHHESRHSAVDDVAAQDTGRQPVGDINQIRPG